MADGEDTVNGLLPLSADDPALERFKQPMPPTPAPAGNAITGPGYLTPQQQALVKGMPQSHSLSNPSTLPGGLPTQPTVNASTVAANPAAAAISDQGVRQYVLNRIAKGEASDYNVMYGGSTFSSYADHPRKLFYTPEGTPTHAAGRYQFQPGTWDSEAKSLGLKDFSPENQDSAAWDLAQRTYQDKTGRDLSADVRAGKTQWSALGGQWSSLKGAQAGGPAPSAVNSAAPSASTTGASPAGGRAGNDSGASPLGAESSPSAAGAPNLMALGLIQAMFPQHKFTPVQYDPWQVAPKLSQ